MQAATIPESSIPPFPDNIDRLYFASWLSGMIDGEGHFQLRYKHFPEDGKFTSYLRFGVSLRQDDLGVLLLIQSFFGCGTLTLFDNERSKMPNASPVACYYVHKTSRLIQSVVPHFEAFPLLAKKRNDFEIWKEGVAIKHKVMLRHGNRKWTDRDRTEFMKLADHLRQQRQYRPADDWTARPMPAAAADDDYPLFKTKG